MNPSYPSSSSTDSEAERVLSRVSDAFFALNSEWEFTYLNDRAEKLLQRPAAEIVGANIWDEFPHAGEGVFFDRFLAAMDTQESVKFTTYDERFETWFQIIAYPSTEGLSVYFKDITESVLKERAIETAEMGIVIIDPHQSNTPIIYANEGFEQLTGYTEAEVIGQNCSFLQGTDTDTRSIAELQRAFDNEQSITVTLVNYQKSGIPFWNRVNINPIFDSHGVLTYFIAFHQEVTSLVERDRRVKLLQRVLRHNLRNELNVLRGNLESIDEGLLSQSEGITRAVDAANNLLQISERVRQIDLILEKVPFDPQPMSLDALLADAVVTAETTFPDAEISVDLPENTTILGTAGLGEAIEEVITNALQHSEATAPILEVTSEEITHRSQSGIKEHPAIRIHFADEAPHLGSIDKQSLLSPKETPLEHGSGLGLWLVHWLVAFSGGSIQYRERSRQGNVISITILKTKANS